MIRSRWPDNGRIRVAWHASSWLWYCEHGDADLWHTPAAMRELPKEMRAKAKGPRPPKRPRAKQSG